MASIQGKFLLSPAGAAANGVPVSLYLASDFTSPPVKDTPLPIAAPQATTTTGPQHGGGGYWRFTGLPAATEYYAAISYAGHTVYDYRATPAAAGIDPTNLFLWFKADAITGLSDGDPVALWPDSGPHGHDLVQATAANRPTYFANQQNGLPAVFNASGGSGSFLYFSPLPALARGQSTYYYVVQPVFGANPPPMPLWDISRDTFASDGTDVFFQFALGGASFNQFTYHIDNLYPPLVYASGAVGYYGWQIKALVMDRANSEIRLYDLDSVDAPTVTNAYTGAGGTDNFLALGIYADVGHAFTGDFGELLVYSVAHDAAQVAATFAILNAKWAVV